MDFAHTSLCFNYNWKKIENDVKQRLDTLDLNYCVIADKHFLHQSVNYREHFLSLSVNCDKQNSMRRYVIILKQTIIMGKIYPKTEDFARN